MKLALLFGMMVLLFGCVVQPAGPLEENIKPPAGLDVKDAMETDDSGSQTDESGAANESSANETSEGNESSTETNVDSSELEKHNSLTDCWVLYDGEVYDVTDYLLKHPGGSQPIADHCGKTDSSFEDAFEGQHGMSKVEFLMNMSHMGSHMGGMMGN